MQTPQLSAKLLTLLQTKALTLPHWPLAHCCLLGWDTGSGASEPRSYQSLASHSLAESLNFSEPSFAQNKAEKN